MTGRGRRAKVGKMRNRPAPLVPPTASLGSILSSNVSFFKKKKNVQNSVTLTKTNSGLNFTSSLFDDLMVEKKSSKTQPIYC